jgi:hypothetical protein
VRYHVLVKELCSNAMVTVIVDSHSRLDALIFAEAKTFGGSAIGVKDDAPVDLHMHGTILPAEKFWRVS